MAKVPPYPVCMRPNKHEENSEELFYTEWIESVRKDIECVFGIMKSRFRFLRNAVCYHEKESVEQAFKTAAILHNMLLSYDGLNLDFGQDLEAVFESQKMINDLIKYNDNNNNNNNNNAANKISYIYRFSKITY